MSRKIYVTKSCLCKMYKWQWQTCLASCFVRPHSLITDTFANFWITLSVALQGSKHGKSQVKDVLYDEKCVDVTQRVTDMTIPAWQVSPGLQIVTG